MVNKELIAEIGNYIDRHYRPPKKDDIKIDSEMQMIFDQITQFREKRREERSLEFLGEDQKKNMQQPMNAYRMMDSLHGTVEKTFTQRLFRLMDERGMHESDLYGKVGIDPLYFLNIKNDRNYHPSKTCVLAFSFALKLSLDEAKDLLQSAGYALSRTSKFDVIAAYFLQNKIYDMLEINDVLDAYNQPVFE